MCLLEIVVFIKNVNISGLLFMMTSWREINRDYGTNNGGDDLPSNFILIFMWGL